MCNQINTIGQNVSRGLFSAARTIQRKAVLTAAVTAVAGLAVTARPAAAVISDATSVATTLLPGISSEVDNISGGSTYGDSITYKNTNTYNMHYAGNDLRVDQINTSTASWIPTGTANAVVRRFDGPTTDIVWYAGNGNTSVTDQYVQASQVGGFTQAFSGNNLLVGTDNLFSNHGDSRGNNTNVERLDMLFFGGFNASGSTAFTIFDRGVTGQHDAFKMAAITGLDQNGVPNSYGPLLSFAAGSWGNTDVVAAKDYVVTRRDYTNPSDPWHPSAIVDQPIGGTVVPTNDLVADGTTIYGYSIFAADTHGAGSQLADWTNTTDYPTNTNSTVTGGLDAIGTAAVLYTSSIPEPSTAALALVAIGGLLVRRPRKTVLA